VFESLFAEGDSNNARPSRDDSLHRTCIQVEDDFDLLHNILYYLHTNIISFGTHLFDEQASLPKLCAAEDIYAMADRLLLDDLKKKAFDFLELTCTVENITARLFGRFAMLYKEVGNMYAEYYHKNWNQVKHGPMHKAFFEKRGSEGDATEIIEVFRRYREVMENEK
jgi:hypothetical protein